MKESEAESDDDDDDDGNYKGNRKTAPPTKNQRTTCRGQGCRAVELGGGAPTRRERGSRAATPVRKYRWAQRTRHSQVLRKPTDSGGRVFVQQTPVSSRAHRNNVRYCFDIGPGMDIEGITAS